MTDQIIVLDLLSLRSFQRGPCLRPQGLLGGRLAGGWGPVSFLPIGPNPLPSAVGLNGWGPSA